jgi:diguanylate cyclase (GGDEF)-like protein
VNLRKMKKRKAREARADASVPAAADTEAHIAGPKPDPEPGAVTAPEAKAADAARAADARDEVDDDADFAERAEIVELMYRAALTRAEAAEAKEHAAETRAAEVEARQQSVDERAAAIDGRVAAIEELEQLAIERTAIAEAAERALSERASAAAAREQALAERLAAVEARERVATERDSIANSRDRGAVERDSIANTRDRAAVERESTAQRRPRETRETPDSFDVQDEALDRARLEAELQRAHLDGLTGAFRREMGRLALRNEIDRARRSDGKFVIAYIDVDGLKGVNDRNGHAAGDRVLRMLVATMRANLRSYDPIVRFGGDEFVCGIASIDPSEVQHRIGVIDQSMRHTTGVGITAGLAELTPSESLDDLTARADAALIAAKQDRTE